MVGAVLFAYLWSRLWRFLVRKVAKVQDPTRLWIAYAIAWALAVILGGFGYADGGPWAGGKALLIYTPALAVWLVVDWLALKKQPAEQTPIRRLDL